jgi:hypothetical protein
MSTASPTDDGALPPELTGRHHGWFGGYRRYPVFSAGWARGRVRSLGLLALLTLALSLLPVAAAQRGMLPLGGVAQLAVQALLPLLAGSWLGVWIRRRGLAPARELAALVAMVLGLVLLVLAFHEYAAEPMKQTLAELTGQVDERGQRKRLVMSIGVFVSSPDDAASAPAEPAAPGRSDGTRWTNAASSAAASFWLAGGLAIVGLRRERRALAALARERELVREQAARREAELQLSVLAAQVEPHFLFNTLAGVRSAIATDPARAAELVDRLVDYLRASIPRLRASGGSEATLGGQLDIVRAYLGLMAARLPRLQWQVEAEPGLLERPFPPWMLISLAENAVKHGVEPKIGPARIEVSARRTDADGVEVAVADDGAGFGASAAGTGLGLANIRQRLQQMYPGGGAALTLKARPEGGVVAILTLPPG